MKISRRDTIVIAVLVNVALLAALFATASRLEDKPQVVGKETSGKQARQETAPIAVQEASGNKKLPVDEIDQVLKEYALRQKVVHNEEPKKKVAETAEAPVKKSAKKAATKNMAKKGM